MGIKFIELDQQSKEIVKKIVQLKSQLQAAGQDQTDQVVSPARPGQPPSKSSETITAPAGETPSSTPGSVSPGQSQPKEGDDEEGFEIDVDLEEDSPPLQPPGET